MFKRRGKIKILLLYSVRLETFSNIEFQLTGYTNLKHDEGCVVFRACEYFVLYTKFFIYIGQCIHLTFLENS